MNIKNYEQVKLWNCNRSLPKKVEGTPEDIIYYIENLEPDTLDTGGKDKYTYCNMDAMTLVRQLYYAISKENRSNPEVLKAFARNAPVYFYGSICYYCGPDNERNDFLNDAYVKAILEGNGNMIKHMPSHFRTKENINIALESTIHSAFELDEKEIDEAIALKVLQGKGLADKNYLKHISSNTLKQMNEKQLYEIYQAAARNKESFNSIPDTYKSNKAFTLSLPLSYVYPYLCDSPLGADLEVQNQAIKENANNAIFVPESQMQRFELIDKVLGDTFDFVYTSTRYTEQYNCFIENIPKEYIQENPEKFTLFCILNEPHLVNKLSEVFSQEEIKKLILSSDRCREGQLFPNKIYEYISDELKRDKDILKACFHHSQYEKKLLPTCKI